MSKRITNFLIFGMLIIISLGLLAGCGGKKLPHNAVIYGDIYENRTWLKDDFYEANLTYGSFSSAIEDYIQDEDCPSFRTEIIVNRDEYEAVFKEFPTEVDFDKTMIVMHCFTTVSGSSYEISNISINEQNLIINYITVRSKKRAVGNASMPLSKWVIVTLDKLDIESVECIFGN